MTRTDTVTDEFRHLLATDRTPGIEYASAIGQIAAIARRSNIGLHAGKSDAERLAAIVEVLDALDRVHDEASG